MTLSDGRQLNATTVGVDPETDIAVVKLSAENLAPIPLDNSVQLLVGDYVVAIGNPFGIGQTIDHGIVSALRRASLGIEAYEDFIQTDASINPGIEANLSGSIPRSSVRAVATSANLDGLIS